MLCGCFWGRFQSARALVYLVCPQCCLLAFHWSWHCSQSIVLQNTSAITTSWQLPVEFYIPCHYCHRIWPLCRKNRVQAWHPRLARSSILSLLDPPKTYMHTHGRPKRETRDARVRFFPVFFSETGATHGAAWKDPRGGRKASPSRSGRPAGRKNQDAAGPIWLLDPMAIESCYDQLRSGALGVVWCGNGTPPTKCQGIGVTFNHGPGTGMTPWFHCTADGNWNLWGFHGATGENGQPNSGPSLRQMGNDGKRRIVTQISETHRFHIAFIMPTLPTPLVFVPIDAVSFRTEGPVTGRGRESSSSTGQAEVHGRATSSGESAKGPSLRGGKEENIRLHRGWRGGRGGVEVVEVWKFFFSLHRRVKTEESLQ